MRNSKNPRLLVLINVGRSSNLCLRESSSVACVVVGRIAYSGRSDRRSITQVSVAGITDLVGRCSSSIAKISVTRAPNSV